MSRARILADYVSSGDELADKAPLASPAFTGTPTGITGTHITSGTLGNTVQDNITRLGTVTSGNLSNTAIVYPAGHVIQVVTREDLFNFTAKTRNNTSWGNLSDSVYSNAITVQKGNKVLFLLQGCKFYTTGTTNHNGTIRAYATDGTNSQAGNSGIQQNQNYSLDSQRLWGATSSGMLITASGSGTVGVTFSIQGLTDSSGTIHFGDPNANNSGAYILWEIQS